MGRLSRGVGFPTVAGPTARTRFIRKTGEIPILQEEGKTYAGKFGPVVRRKKGDYLAINETLSNLRQSVADRRRSLVETFNSLDSSQRQDFLDSNYQQVEQEIAEAELQKIIIIIFFFFQ